MVMDRRWRREEVPAEQPGPWEDELATAEAGPPDEDILGEDPGLCWVPDLAAIVEAGRRLLERRRSGG